MVRTHLCDFYLIALKEKGNKAFAKGDYAAAILSYSEGLDKMKDMKVLYTNRAQVSEPQASMGFSWETFATNLVKMKTK